MDGEGTYLEADYQLPLQKNTMVLSRPYNKHKILNNSSLFLIYVGFELISSESSPIAIEQFRRLNTTSKFYISDASHTPTVRIWEALLQSAGQTHPLYQKSIRALANTLITSFSSLFSDEELNAKKVTNRKMNSEADLLVYKAKLFIQDNLASPDLMLADIAKILHISELHLSRIFKEELGQT